MRSLLIRIFVSFWAIIVITIATAGVLGYAYAERVRDSLQNFEVSDAMLEASASLQQHGREGLTDWLRSLPAVTGSMIYVLDDRGRDLLERPLPAAVEIAMRRFGGMRFGPPPEREFRNLRPARPFTQLVGPAGDTYTLFVLPPRGKLAKWFAERGLAGLVFLALLVSAGISYWLARAISTPVRRLRESADAIAGGNLETRVADRVGRRSDEIGLLAQDFDRMARGLQLAWQRQTELMRNVSHELRSPLARLRVALELARRKKGQLPELDKIDLETERLNGLIGQILEFSRLDSDVREDTVDIDLNDLVLSVVEDARYEYGCVDSDPGIAFDADRSIAISGYPSALRSAVENLLRNAMQHGAEKGGVTVQLRQDETDAVITVSDQGGGVPEDQLSQIFEPFFRVHTDRGQAKNGSGLGLAIVARAVAMHEGSMTASNAAGGLSIEIRLPRTR